MRTAPPTRAASASRTRSPRRWWRPAIAKVPPRAARAGGSMAHHYRGMRACPAPWHPRAVLANARWRSGAPPLRPGRRPKGKAVVPAIFSAPGVSRARRRRRHAAVRAPQVPAPLAGRVRAADEDAARGRQARRWGAPPVHSAGALRRACCTVLTAPAPGRRAACTRQLGPDPRARPLGSCPAWRAACAAAPCPVPERSLTLCAGAPDRAARCCVCRQLYSVQPRARGLGWRAWAGARSVAAAAAVALLAFGLSGAPGARPVRRRSAARAPGPRC